jgi:hypothetical protein
MTGGRPTSQPIRDAVTAHPVPTKWTTFASVDI